MPEKPEEIYQTVHPCVYLVLLLVSFHLIGKKGMNGSGLCVCVHTLF